MGGKEMAILAVGCNCCGKAPNDHKRVDLRSTEDGDTGLQNMPKRNYCVDQYQPDPI